MATTFARPYHTLDSHHIHKNSGRRKCRCCPYGYHIDLDFVRYCETIACSQVLSELPVRKTPRWNVRKRRASKETLLGIAGMAQLSDDSSKASQDVGDDLQKAVLDFEKVLISSTRSSTGKSRNSSKCKDWLIPKDGEDHVKKCAVPSNQRDITTVCENFIQDDNEIINLQGTNNASPQMLQMIRKQMATSLARMRQLEDEVKVIPNLQEHISNLEKDNIRLQNELEKQIKENKAKDKKSELVDASTATRQICHTRNVGIGCTVITREIGISSSVRMVSCGTDCCGTQLSSIETDKTGKPCPISLENILGSSSKSPSKNVGTCTERIVKPTKDASTETELKLHKILTEDEVNKKMSTLNKELEAQMKKQLTTVGVITQLRHNEIYTKQDMEKLTHNNKIQKDLKKVLMVNASEQTTPLRQETRDNSVQAVRTTSDIGILARVNVTDSWVQMIKSCRDVAVSNHTINDPCFKCCVKKVSIGTQNIAEIKQVLLDGTKSQNTDTSDLLNVKDQGINTTKMKLVNTGSDAGLLSCAKCNALQTESNVNNTVSNQQKLNRPSYLPVPTHAQTKSRSARASTAVSRLRSEDYGSESGSDDGGYNQQNEDILPRHDTLKTFHPIQPKSYKKEPSKEMKGALKVLNDALQKFSSDNFPKHMRNAVNIVQQEWFKVSSVADANPLDVEDYLDCFEEISGTLLEYIVNMTDVTGNTAMHYAVSNGNFDVVSILLDSKVCNINKMNTAGYTCIMLVALTKVKSETDRQVVRRLFHMADVNIRAKQHGQTALMLAVSHGRIDTVELLLESGGDINIQDEDGSTALMCAAEHGYIDIVKLLLTQPDCDLTITDYDGSTALAIAMDAGNRDIGVLLYAQEHFSRGGSPFTPSKNHRRAKSATPTLRGGTPTPSSQGEVPH